MSRLFEGTAFDRPRKCERCGKAMPECRCLALPEKKKMSQGKGGGQKLDSGLVLTPENSVPPKDQVATIRVEKRKGARVVTVVAGLDHPANDLPKLCTELRQAMGVGGSVQERSIELQGDQQAKVAALLEEREMKVRQR
jgi:translation initiation factor 1